MEIYLIYDAKESMCLFQLSAESLWMGDILIKQIMKQFQSFALFQLSSEGLWVIELKLEPGTYEYKYLIMIMITYEYKYLINGIMIINMLASHESTPV